MELKDKVTCIKGIGEKTAGNLAKLGISTVSDLIQERILHIWSLLIFRIYRQMSVRQ